MKNIKPISDLKNYNKVLDEIRVGEPVYITDNGIKKYVILDINEYERTNAAIKLISELSKGEKSAYEKGWTDIAKVEKILGI